MLPDTLLILGGVKSLILFGHTRGVTNLHETLHERNRNPILVLSVYGDVGYRLARWDICVTVYRGNLVRTIDSPVWRGDPRMGCSTLA